MTVHAAFLSFPKLGERVNGDGALVRRDDRERVLVAVVDSLGHGPGAAEATQVAMASLEACELASPVVDLMQGLHAALRSTRGAAATICVIQGRKIAVCAVGNVQLASANATVPLVLSSGVLGHRVPKFRACEGELRPGARIALFSDGISSKFRLDESLRLKPAEACRLAIERHRKHEDDSTILMADMDGQDGH
jgi:negative regulator of sigma-B (phosphoserine phosphatase)